METKLPDLGLLARKMAPGGMSRAMTCLDMLLLVRFAALIDPIRDDDGGSGTLS
jgi:hypothetical protein